jgi:hypothetical protein
MKLNQILFFLGMIAVWNIDMLNCMEKQKSKGRGRPPKNQKVATRSDIVDLANLIHSNHINGLKKFDSVAKRLDVIERILLKIQNLPEAQSLLDNDELSLSFDALSQPKTQEGIDPDLYVEFFGHQVNADSEPKNEELES